MNMIKVSATSRTSAVAGAIAGVVREHHRAEIQAIGAGAVNQAVKALVLATGYLRLDGIHVSCVPEFAEVTIEDQGENCHQTGRGTGALARQFQGPLKFQSILK